MERSQLLEKARRLPLSPGVYIMKNPAGRVIYVGKSKALRNRVSSYFASGAKHSGKTLKMVASVGDFEVYYTETEIEALVLENQFIKQYMPRYNIKLKDSKGYPYVCVTNGEYPRVTVTYKREGPGAYFGPFSSAGAAQSIRGAVLKAMQLPQCAKSFPKDIGTRPCLNCHIGACIAPCRGGVSHEDYMKRVSGAKKILRGDIRPLLRELQEDMEKAAQAMEYEQAAAFRDCITAVKKLESKQNVITSPDVNEDVFGFFTDELGSCAVVLMIRGGAVTDREHFFFGADEILDSSAAAALMQRYYQLRGFVPDTVLCDSLVSPDDRGLLTEYLCSAFGVRARVAAPERGEKKRVVEIACDNARELILHQRSTTKRSDDFLTGLARLLGLESVPLRIEAYDISNNGENDTTAGMIVLEDGKFCKGKYRSFNIRTAVRDDYEAMRETMLRRFSHEGEGWELPDLVLVDGGAGHVAAARGALESLGLGLPVFGMVKDGRHKTRTLTDGTSEIAIASKQEIYVFFYKIQEEVHRYAFGRMDVRRRRAVRRSPLEEIKGIGPSKAALLNARFGGLRGVRAATKEELMSVRGITERDAQNIRNALGDDVKGE